MLFGRPIKRAVGEEAASGTRGVPGATLRFPVPQKRELDFQDTATTARPGAGPRVGGRMRAENGHALTTEPFRGQDALACLVLAGVLIACCGRHIFDPRCGE